MPCAQAKVFISCNDLKCLFLIRKSFSLKEKKRKSAFTATSPKARSEYVYLRKEELIHDVTYHNLTCSIWESLTSQSRRYLLLSLY